jgi:hypothetical protein
VPVPFACFSLKTAPDEGLTLSKPTRSHDGRGGPAVHAAWHMARSGAAYHMDRSGELYLWEPVYLSWREGSQTALG